MDPLYSPLVYVVNRVRWNIESGACARATRNACHIHLSLQLTADRQENNMSENVIHLCQSALTGFPEVCEKL